MEYSGHTEQLTDDRWGRNISGWCHCTKKTMFANKSGMTRKMLSTDWCVQTGNIWVRPMSKAGFQRSCEDWVYIAEY